MTNNRKYSVNYKGEPVAWFSNHGEAVAAVDLYEEIDRDAGIYEAGCYEITKIRRTA